LHAEPELKRDEGSDLMVRFDEADSANYLARFNIRRRKNPSLMLAQASGTVQPRPQRHAPPGDALAKIAPCVTCHPRIVDIEL